MQASTKNEDQEETSDFAERGQRSLDDTCTEMMLSLPGRFLTSFDDSMRPLNLQLLTFATMYTSSDIVVHAISSIMYCLYLTFEIDLSVEQQFMCVNDHAIQDYLRRTSGCDVLFDNVASLGLTTVTTT